MRRRPGQDELDWIDAIVHRGRGLLDSEELARVRIPDGKTFPVKAIRIGPDDRSLPTLGIFAGVHGLETIGTHTVLAFLESLVELLRWDPHERARFEAVRLVAIPLVNPGGMALNRRSNPRGVDLMRNAPVDAVSRVSPLVGGHRLGPFLPWYRGKPGREMEVEARALVDFVERELFEADTCLALDVHSGFGTEDRLWYPYAKQVGGFPAIQQTRGFVSLLHSTYPNHVYVIEPQSASYTTHGDLWDHCFDRHRDRNPEGVFLPWTLEMGSWRWIRKNPRQVFSREGPFNPVLPHRYKRVMRRHVSLFRFFLSAVHNRASWDQTLQEAPPRLREVPGSEAD